MRRLTLAWALWVCVPVLLGADVVDRPLETARQIHDGALKRADTESQKAQQKFTADKADADAKLVKAYDAAIKRATQRGDLEGGNRLLAEKKALEGGADVAPPATAPAATAAPADRLLDTAKQIHEAAIKKADFESLKALQKIALDKSQADAKFVKAYEDAIKRATQRGDLESANRLIAARKALESGGDAPHSGDASPAAKLNWTPLGKDGIPPGVVITDIGSGEVESDYVNFLNKADKTAKVHEHEVTVIKANEEGAFKGPGPKNIEINYYAFYVRADASQTANLTLRTSPFGGIKVYLDGTQIHEHQANNHDKYETKIPLTLQHGSHVIVIRHANSWAANWIAVQLEGSKLLTAE